MTDNEIKQAAKAYRNNREQFVREKGGGYYGFLNDLALDEIEDAYINGAKQMREQMLYEIKGKTTCKTCKNRWDDGHFSFPDCRDGHKDENRKMGKNCPYYQFDADIL